MILKNSIYVIKTDRLNVQKVTKYHKVVNSSKRVLKKNIYLNHKQIKQIHAISPVFIHVKQSQSKFVPKY